MVVRLSALRTGRLYPPRNTPGTHFCWRLSQSQGHSVIGRNLCQWKIPMTPAGIEPATFRFVAQHLNHWATAVPPVSSLRKKERLKTRVGLDVLKKIIKIRLSSPQRNTKFPLPPQHCYQPSISTVPHRPCPALSIYLVWLTVGRSHRYNFLWPMVNITLQRNVYFRFPVSINPKMAAYITLGLLEGPKFHYHCCPLNSSTLQTPTVTAALCRKCSNKWHCASAKMNCVNYSKETRLPATRHGIL